MNTNIRKMTLAAMFLAIGQVLPFITGQIPQIGVMLSPMHFPVLLCGMVCGWQYGGLVGFICPLLRSILFGMPRMYPNAVGMAFELCTYGIVSGLILAKFEKKTIPNIYIALITAMLAGRVVWGIAQTLLLSGSSSPFTFQAFLAGGFLNAIPGIIAQLILIPLIMRALVQGGLVR
ncbi:MAG: ECF transporter S component [Solobacterium sp.]|nr:ECF transporter S component [Solobacterium sp.]